MESFFTCGPFTSPAMGTLSMAARDMGEEKKNRQIYSSDAISKCPVDDNEGTVFMGSSLLHPPKAPVSGFEFNGDRGSSRTIWSEAKLQQM